MNYKRMISELISLDNIEKSEILSIITPTADNKMGDFSVPCFKFSKQLKLSAQGIAENLANKISAEMPSWISEVKAVSGYLNIYIQRVNFINDTISEIRSKGAKWENKKANGKTVCIDYSSINIAKPFHIGHLLTTVIGGSLYRIYKYLGYNVVGINHLGDWGTQFGKLITAYLKWGSDEDIKNRSVNALLDLYVKFHQEADKDDSLNDEGRKWFKKIEDGDETALKIFNHFKEITLLDVAKLYETLGIEFDSYNGESFYNDKLQPVVEQLQEKKLLTVSEGAHVVNLDEFGMPPCLILKSDGASLYATRDLAAAIYRKKTYDFDKSLYVVAYQQNLHFKQVFKTLELMGYEWAKDCVHVPFGMVSLEDGTLSTRNGKIIFLAEVLNTSIEKTMKIIDAKNPQLDNKADVAKAVGVGAVVFGALSNSRIKDMVFSYDKALNFDGETGPYIQYTHARCCSILNKAKQLKKNVQIDYLVLKDDESFGLLKLLGMFEDTVLDASVRYEPSLITRLLIDIAQSFNKFYFEKRILGEDENITTARLVLTECVKNTLANGLQLILMQAPQAM